MTLVDERRQHARKMLADYFRDPDYLALREPDGRGRTMELRQRMLARVMLSPSNESVITNEAFWAQMERELLIPPTYFWRHQNYLAWLGVSRELDRRFYTAGPRSGSMSPVLVPNRAEAVLMPDGERPEFTVEGFNGDTDYEDVYTWCGIGGGALPPLVTTPVSTSD